MHGELLLRLADEAARGVGQTGDMERHHHEIAMAQAQFARGHLQHLRLPAMAVGQQQLAKSCAVHRLTDLGHHRQQRRAGQRHRAGKVQVFVRLAVGDGRQTEGAYRGGQLLQRLAQHPGRDDAVHRAGQVRPVLLDRTHRQHDDRVRLVLEFVDLGPAQVGQEALGRDVAVHHGGSEGGVLGVVGVVGTQRRASAWRRRSMWSRSGVWLAGMVRPSGPHQGGA